MTYKGIIIKDKEDFLEVQLKEIEIKEKEIDLKLKQSEINIEFAKESLKRQSQDLRDFLNVENKRDKLFIAAISLIIFLCFTIIMGAMYFNKDELMMELLRAFGYVFGSGITGYGLGLQKGKDKDKAKQSK